MIRIGLTQVRARQISPGPSARQPYNWWYTCSNSASRPA